MYKSKFIPFFLTLLPLIPTTMSYAQHSGGTIQIMGAVTDTTCTINDGLNDFSVLLPPIAKTEVPATPGLITTGPSKKFSIRLKNCHSTLGDKRGALKMHFSGPHIDSTGTFITSGTEGQNVGFALINSADNKTINFDQHFETTALGTKQGDDYEALNFEVKYYKTKTGEAKLGRTDSTLIYTLYYL